MQHEGHVVAVAAGPGHAFSKPQQPRIELIEGVGVAGDGHAGARVQHRSRVAANPDQPNLRQVHLLPAERLAELAEQGFDLAPGAVGENVLTEGLDLHALPKSTLLRLGEALVSISGLRNPCAQLDAYREGLTRACLGRHPDGSLALRAGVMAVVLQSGEVAPGDRVEVHLPPPPHIPLARV
ncbi:MOSC domain-containing protein [Pontivivens ytuae]|uniref:MOSC domain-containing protein n=1 Tax=Pontivivens ytuae TaxID=2789856 RepID=A0A7S9QBZ9_9RHOB|nr:MOSC domain-containing protein [Pontivivens ytuae]QPH53408.1 MOSC domain-containing protein [Pontivivens ytuae]